LIPVLTNPFDAHAVDPATTTTATATAESLFTMLPPTGLMRNAKPGE
jgi:hypothetical protein